MQPRQQGFWQAAVRRPGAVLRRHLFVVAACCSLGGCAGFWDEVTSRDFKFKDMFKPAPEPLWVLRNSTDGDKRSKALLALKEPLQNGGTQQEQDVIVKLLIQSATSDPQPLCRLAAIATLQHFKDPRAAQTLLDAYDRAAYFQRDRPEAMETIQEQAIQALGVNGNPIAIDDLVKIVKSSKVVGNDKETGNAEDLEEAISALERTLAEGGQVQPIGLGNLGAMLYKRYERTGSLADLNRAIDAVGRAIDVTPAGHSDQALYLSNLSTWLRTRDERTVSVPDLDCSVEVSSKATKNDMPSVPGAPEGETIYANTPQHHRTALLLQMSGKPGTGIES